MKSWIQLAIWLGAIMLAKWTSHAIEVYDCEDPRTRFQTVDLTEVEPCPDPIRKYEKPRTKQVQVLMADTQTPVTAYQCKASVSRQVTKCGFSSITYGTKQTVWAKTYTITPNECRRAMQQGIILIDGQTYHVKRGERFTHTYFSQGAVDQWGNCEVAAFQSGDRFYNGFYEESIVDVEMNEVHGILDTASQIVVFENGLQANYKDEVLRDTFKGTMVWDIKELECQNTVSEVYLGEALVYATKGGLLQDAIVMIANNITGQYAGLVLEEPKTICRAHCHLTQLKGVLACVMREMDEPIPGTSFKAHTRQEGIDVYSQISYSHLNTNLRMYSHFEAVHADICKNNKLILQTRLQAIAGTSNPYSLLDLYGPGHATIVAGAVAYVSRCYPIEANKADFPNCTLEIPVDVNGTVRFADPLLFTLNPYPTVVPCSNVMPIRWKIQDIWYCSNPSIQRCEAPLKLNITTVAYLGSQNFIEGLGRHLFTNLQQRQHHLFWVAIAARIAVLQDVTTKATEDQNKEGKQGYYIGPPLSQADVDWLTFVMGGALFPLYPVLGSTWVLLASIVLIGSILITLVGCIARMVTIFLEQGCGWWVLVAMWSTGFAILRLPTDLWRATTDFVEREDIKAGIIRRGKKKVNVELKGQRLLGDEPDTKAKSPALSGDSGNETIGDGHWNQRQPGHSQHISRIDRPYQPPGPSRPSGLYQPSGPPRPSGPPPSAQAYSDWEDDDDGPWLGSNDGSWVVKPPPRPGR